MPSSRPSQAPAILSPASLSPREDACEQHLDPADRSVLGRLAASMPLDRSVLRAAEWVREAADAQIGLLSHTTFGDGLPAGPVSA